MALLLAGLFGLGLLHGLGPDHLAALGTLASRGGGRIAALRAAVGFGLGHALSLGVGALLCLTLGWAVPEAVERAAELGGGVLVALLGLAALLEAAGLRVHRHGGAVEGLHVHVGRAHAHPAATRATDGAAVVGAALAISGVRGLLLLLPTASTGSPLPIVLGVVAFGAGVVTSMVLAVLAGDALRRLPGLSTVASRTRLARGLVGAASLVVGCAWFVAAL